MPDPIQQTDKHTPYFNGLNGVRVEVYCTFVGHGTYTAPKIVPMTDGPDTRDAVEYLRTAVNSYDLLTAARAENERLRAENDKVRYLLANADIPCVYCGLDKADMAKCQLGFPGCDRADDLVFDDLLVPPSPPVEPASGDYGGFASAEEKADWDAVSDEVSAEGHGHSTKCMREASVKMGRGDLHSCYVFKSDAVDWLASKGKLVIEGSDAEGWSVECDPPDGDDSVCSGGHSLTEALCGAIHALAPADPAKEPAMLQRVLKLCGSEHDLYYSHGQMAEAAAIRDLIPMLMQLKEPNEEPRG